MTYRFNEMSFNKSVTELPVRWMVLIYYALRGFEMQLFHACTDLINGISGYVCQKRIKSSEVLSVFYWYNLHQSLDSPYETYYESECMCVHACVCETEYVCVCVCEREREREMTMLYL